MPHGGLSTAYSAEIERFLPKGSRPWYTRRLGRRPAPPRGEALMPDFVVIATWTFGETAVKAAVPLLRQGKPALDAAVAGAQAVEDDPKVTSVGYGGLPNA